MTKVTSPTKFPDVGSGVQLLPPLQERGALVRYGIAAIAILSAAVLRALVAPGVGPQTYFAFLLPATFLAAWFGGARGGLFAVGLGAVVGAVDSDPPLTFRQPADAAHLLLFIANGAIMTGLCAILRRLAGRTRAARAEAARNFEIMANNVPVLIWMTDAGGRCVFVNRTWGTFTGRPLGPAGIRSGEVHPADVAEYQRGAAEATDARKPYQLEYRLRRADGAYRWLNEHAVPRFGRENEFEGYIGSCSDVTDARHEREELAFIARVQTALAESLDLDRCADALVQSFVPRLADWCSIQLVDRAGRLERLRVRHGGPGAADGAPVNESAAGAEDPLAAGVVATGETRVLTGKNPVLPALVGRDEAHRERLRALPAMAYVGVPLRVRGHVIGVLAVATAESGRPLGPPERGLVEKISGMASLALDNALLYRSARQALEAGENARREMERSERRFRFIWDANLFGMCTVARSGRILSANQAFADLLGYSADDVAAGRATFHARTDPAWQAADQRANDELEHTGRCSPFEKEYLRPDGARIQALVGGSLLPDSDECMAFVVDLTERRHAERALDRQRMLLHTLIDAIPAAVGYIGADERVRLHNDRCREWLGCAELEFEGRTARELLGPAGYERVAPYLNAAFRGRTMRQETRIELGGRARHLIASYRPDRDADGRVCGVVVHAYDITERKETEQALADALTRYRFLADAMPQMVWTALPDGRLDYVNRRWLETTGLTEAASLASGGWLEAIHVEDRKAVGEGWRAAVAARAPFAHECRLRCRPEFSWRWHLVRTLPRHDDAGTLVQWVGSATDIDEQRRAYAELAEARERLKSHAEELEARVRARTATLREANAELEAFTYSVSHDLRTPLQFVRGFAEAIEDDAGNALSAEHRDHLARIIRAAARMDAIIQDLLAYSRLSRSDVQLLALPLEDVIADVLSNHLAMIRQSGATVAVEKPLPTVCADKTGLYQALSNLVSNALKFSRPNCPPALRIRAERRDGRIRLWVEDHGIGIEPRHHERIFQLFERLHSPAEYPGTGIGLSLVRKAAQRMGGACGVDSAPGAGSRFWLEFPPVPARAPSAHAPA